MRRMTWDRVFAAFLLPLVLCILAVLYIIVVPLQGRPFLFVSERMRTPTKQFGLLKIRTMHPRESDMSETVLGGDQSWRVTPIGRWLRRTRLDELPQIFNILRGEMQFIGPRPPLRVHVLEHPVLYRRVLEETPPGVTGLATVMLHAREERLLRGCRTAEETEAVYRRRCIPIKARLDLIYSERRCFRLQLLILWMTLSRLFPRRRAALAQADQNRKGSACSKKLRFGTLVFAKISD